MSVDQEATPAERVSRRVDGVDVLGAISPSRAADFMTCPLLFRFRTVDRLPEPFSVDAVRGTLVHKVLEDLFSLPAADRTPEAARDMLVPTWEAFVDDDPTLAAMFDEAEAAHEPGFLEWMRSAGEVLDRYFTLEDPRRLEPAERELYVEALLDSKLLLRGFVDRLDVAPDGAIRVVDYKTSSSPHPDFEAKALFQMKFYALAIWRSRGRGAEDAPAHLPRQRRDAALRARRGRPARHRAQGRRALARHQAGRGRAGVAAQPVPGLRLVRAPGDLPGLGWHSPAGPAATQPRRRQSR